MVRLLLGLVLVGALVFFWSFQRSRGVARATFTCNFTIGLTVMDADGTGNFSLVKPGDTVCVTAGDRRELTLKNFHGLTGSPITFVNSGGVVRINSLGYAGIHVRNSSFIHITGAGEGNNCGASFTESAQQCGFSITGNNGRGLSGREKTDNIEVDNLEIKSASESGITIKDAVALRSEWTQYNTKVHDNYIHDITLGEGAEGIYLGESDYLSGMQPVLIGTNVSFNLVRRSGWDGIQVGSAVADCSIHHNKIYEDSQNLVANQMSGIMNNPGSVCDIYDNLVSDGKGPGMYIQGNGGNHIYNNVVVRAGADGIKVSTGSNTGNDVYTLNNTVVSPVKTGIKFNMAVGTSSRIQNNIVVNPGSGLYLDKGSLSNVVVSNNLTKATANEVGFKDALNNDYSLAAGSAAIDVGLDLSSYGVTTDFVWVARPQGLAFDVGAYEFLAAVATPTPLPTPTPPAADGQAPSVAITFPVNNTTVTRGATVTVTATASDNVAVTKVEFYINSSLKCTDLTSAYSCRWKVPGVKGVGYTVLAKAYDASGNIRTSTVSVTSK